MFDTDTIAALATAPGTGGIAIVRVSGSRAEETLQTLFRPRHNFESHKMYYGHACHEGETLDECMAVLMKAPRTYTREDVAEFHLHGGGYAASAVLNALYALGVRPAEPGEFTRRAFLNGRVDLSRAEAVMSLISAESSRAARAALRQLSGGTGSFIAKAQEELLSMLSGAAAALDYPEEISFEEAAGDLAARAFALADKLENACDERGARIAEKGLHAVLCGRPNVGKSSLLNALTRQERAIVTAIPGTTRDIVTADAEINGLRIHYADTAGLRDDADTIEAIGVERAKAAISGADVTLVVLDAARAPEPDEERLLLETACQPRLVILNKCDLPAAAANFPENALRVSAVTGEGLAALENAIAAFGEGAGEGELTQARHMALCRQAAQALREGAEICREGSDIDMAVIDLQEALRLLGRVTGDEVDEKLLDDIFSNFCVGK